MDNTPVRWWLLFLIPLIVLLSFYFLYQTFPIAPAAGEPDLLKPEWYSLTTARGAELENKSIVGNCFICHASWLVPRSEQNSQPRFAHANIVLNHGKNDRCYNCHMVSDRNKYVADNGSGIMPQLPELLCSRCHGLIYNDWLMGTHGKWVGMWQPAKKSDRKTFTCTQCHDPHNPAFKYNTLAPPPVWPDKFIRTVPEESHSDPFSNFLIDEEPKERF